MSYNKKIWNNGDLITKESMNNIEDGICTAHDEIERLKNNTSTDGSGGAVDLSGYVTKETGNANQITFADGQTFQSKLDAGLLKGGKGDKGEQGVQGERGPAGEKGQDGLTTSIKYKEQTYTQVDGEIDLSNVTFYDDSEIKQNITNIQNELGTEELTTTAKNIKAAINENSSQIKEIENNGVTTATVEAKVQSVIDAKIADGTMANLTIADGSITKEKLDPSINFDLESISKKLPPLPIPKEYLDTHTDNYLNKNEIVHDKIYNTNNTEADDANRNYVKVKIKPGETYVDNFYNSSRILFDKDMNYISNGISNLSLNSNYKTAKYTVCNLDDFYCYMVINFYDEYTANPFVIKSDVLESAYNYAEYAPKLDVISSGVTSHSINEMSVKANMLPYVLDGIGCTNYWDAQYNIDNLLKNDGKYVQSAINYLPPGTYTINNCGVLTRIALDGKIDKIIGSNTNLTFEMTEDYCRYTAYIKVDNNLEVLRNIIVQKGTTTDGVKERKYTFDNFAVKNIGYYPTHWEGKKYVAIGDSITRGYAPANESLNIAEGSQIELPYAKYAAQKLGLEFQNLGEDGATVSSAIGYNVFSKINGTPDIISIYLGANDISKLSLGTIDDMYTEGAETCTYYGGLKYIVKKLKETYPLAMIILIGNTYTTTRVSSQIDNFNNAKKEIADLYNVLYLDMARVTGFDLSFESMVTELQLNSIHPNYKAHEIMGSRLTGFIASH